MSGWEITNYNLHIPHCLLYLLPPHRYIKSYLRHSNYKTHMSYDVLWGNSNIESHYFYDLIDILLKAPISRTIWIDHIWVWYFEFVDFMHYKNQKYLNFLIPRFRSHHLTVFNACTFSYWRCQIFGTISSGGW
jgi:hypothetical protein